MEWTHWPFVRRKTFNLLATQFAQLKLDLRVTESKLECEKTTALDRLNRLIAFRSDAKTLRERLTEANEERDNWRKEASK